MCIMGTTFQQFCVMKITCVLKMLFFDVQRGGNFMVMLQFDVWLQSRGPHSSFMSVRSGVKVCRSNFIELLYKQLL